MVEIKTVKKEKEEMIVIADLNVTLANAIRRSVEEIPVLAIDEVEIYKNDSALYDEVIAHRLGLIPLKNQKIKSDVELKLKAKGKESGTTVLSEVLGELVVYPDMPIVLLEKEQEIELVAKARVGKSKNHAKFSPGMIYYKHLPKIKITSEGEKHQELAELFPENFEFDGKLKVKDALAGDIDDEDVKEFPGVKIEFGNELAIDIESWGQIDAKDIFIESAKALKDNLNEVIKALK